MWPLCVRTVVDRLVVVLHTVFRDDLQTYNVVGDLRGATHICAAWPRTRFSTNIYMGYNFSFPQSRGWGRVDSIIGASLARCFRGQERSGLVLRADIRFSIPCTFSRIFWNSPTHVANVPLECRVSLQRPYAYMFLGSSLREFNT